MNNLQRKGKGDSAEEDREGRKKERKKEERGYFRVKCCPSPPLLPARDFFSLN